MHEERHASGDRGTTGQISQLYKLLADHRRRVLLHCLRDTEASLSISALVTELTQRDDREPSERDVKAEIAVHHIHLPKLADAGVIEYDQSNQQAVYTAPPQVDALLEEMLVTASPGAHKPSLQE
ncbi:hypothetical protein [Haladaptatus sp. DYF46]|uniref:DUF7344 domain-containing protein n=1 Tax=Haladaptatus sp. DYF46 TaxID=2886041 RepID=UPI001E4EBC7D|nr:hypothetical protein [Haladaptatus sp. DYF46]